jgi:hypothetical protein
MGWFNTLLDVATLGVGLANAGRLEQMRAQGVAAALIDAFITELRNQIFQFKQAAEGILASEGELPPKIVSGALMVLEARLNESGIVPELFRELSDKEYAASTRRLIRTNIERLFPLLPASEKAEVGDAVSAACQLPDCAYYLDNFDNVRKLEEAEMLRKELAWRNGCLGRFLTVCAAIICYGVTVAVAALLHMQFKSGVLTGIVAIVGILAPLVLLLRWQKARRYKAAGKAIEELSRQVDIERFAALDRQFGRDRGKAAIAQREARGTVEAFFGAVAPRLTG